MPKPSAPSSVLAMLSMLRRDRSWLARTVFAIGVLESVWLVPLALTIPRLGQGGSLWGLPSIPVAFFGAMAALFAAYAIKDRRREAPGDERPHPEGAAAEAPPSKGRAFGAPRRPSWAAWR